MDKITDWVRNGRKYLTTHWRLLQHATKKEKDETIRAYDILIRFLNKETRSDVSKSDIAFLKAQSVDLFKIIVLISIKLVPSPIPITPLMIWLGKKVGVKVLPSSHLKKYENRELGKIK